VDDINIFLTSVPVSIASHDHTILKRGLQGANRQYKRDVVYRNSRDPLYMNAMMVYFATCNYVQMQQVHVASYSSLLVVSNKPASTSPCIYGSFSAGGASAVRTRLRYDHP